jgi:spore coat protein A
VESWYDGHPQSWYTDTWPDGSRDGGERFTEDVPPVKDANETIANGTNIYRNDQAACTLFYHDHAIGITRLNVYAGLAGLYIIDDTEKTQLFVDLGFNFTLYRDLPLSFADKIFGIATEDGNASRNVMT